MFATVVVGIKIICTYKLNLNLAKILKIYHDDPQSQGYLT